jgi:hypothetical protein
VRNCGTSRISWSLLTFSRLVILQDVLRSRSNPYPYGKFLDVTHTSSAVRSSSCLFFTVREILLDGSPTAIVTLRFVFSTPCCHITSQHIPPPSSSCPVSVVSTTTQKYRCVFLVPKSTYGSPSGTVRVASALVCNDEPPTFSRLFSSTCVSTLNPRTSVFGLPLFIYQDLLIARQVSFELTRRSQQQIS